MTTIGAEIVRLEQVDSTNSLVLGRPAYLERHGLVVLARHQTGGRGRMGRQWASLPGLQLQFTVVLHPAFAADDFPAVSLVAGLAVAQGVQAAVGLQPRLKWPNDVMLEGRKLSGILVEGKPGVGGRPRLVVGIGINCNGRATDFPEPLHEKLTTLAEVLGAPVDADPLLRAVLSRLDALYERLAAGEKAALLAEWKDCALLGPDQRVRLRTHSGECEGIPESLTAEGYLVVRLPGGGRLIQVSGDLEWVD